MERMIIDLSKSKKDREQRIPLTLDEQTAWIERSETNQQAKANLLASLNAWKVWLADHPAVLNVLKMEPDNIEAELSTYDITQLRSVITAQSVILAGLTRAVLANIQDNS